MIDLEKERELYLKEFYNDLFIEQIEFNVDEFVWRDSKTTSELDECNHGWKAWIASAQREGYKLVPVEPSEKMMDAGRIAKFETKGSLRQEYKATIGAAP